MNRLSSHWLLAALLAFAAPARSLALTNSWSLRVWQSDDGLPNNSIRTLAQTADGYLWAAAGSVARFDGVDFDKHSCDWIPAARERRINFILPSRDGGLWLAMDHGPIVHLKDGTPFVLTNDLPNTSVEGL